MSTKAQFISGDTKYLEKAILNGKMRGMQCHVIAELKKRLRKIEMGRDILKVLSAYFWAIKQSGSGENAGQAGV